MVDCLPDSAGGDAPVRHLHHPAGALERQRVCAWFSATVVTPVLLALLHESRGGGRGEPRAGAELRVRGQPRVDVRCLAGLRLAAGGVQMDHESVVAQGAVRGHGVQGGRTYLHRARRIPSGPGESGAGQIAPGERHQRGHFPRGHAFPGRTGGQVQTRRVPDSVRHESAGGADVAHRCV